MKSARRDLIILIAYIFLAIALTLPLAFHLTTFQPGEGVDDPALTWSLWWTRYAIFDLGVSPLTTDYVFYPTGINLVAYTPTFLNGILSIPLQFALSVVIAQNLMVYAALVIGGYGTLLLAREIFARLGIVQSRQTDFAAALAGAVYAFGAWHVNYVWGANFFLLSNEWIPFYALYLLRMDKQPWRNGAIAGLFVVFQAWTEMTFALFQAIFTVLYFVYLLLTRRRALNRIFFSNIFMLGIIAIIGASPLFYNLWEDVARYGYYLASGVGRVQIFSAEPISFFIPSARHPILGAWTQTLTQANTHYAFIGYAVLILAIIGLWFRRASREIRFWTILAFLFASIMLGSTLIIGGQSTGVPMPFALLREIPFVNANRYPVRFNVMLMLSLTPLVALGAYRLLQARRGSIVLGALIALMAFEQWVFPIPLSDMRVPEIFQAIRDEPGDFAILEIPLGWRGSISMQGKQDDRTQFFQTIHHKRLLGGITSRIPAFKFQYFLETPVINSLIALETGREVDENRRALDRIAAPYLQNFFDIRYVDVNRELTDDAVMQYVFDMFSLTEVYRDETRTVYRVNAVSLPSNVIHAGLEPANLYFDDRWGRVQYADNGAGYRWATQNESGIWLPLQQRAQTITFRLRGASAQQELSVRVNGQLVAKIQMSDEWQDYHVMIPVSVLRDGLAQFTFMTNAPPIAAVRLDNYAIGDTGVVSPVDISATGAGFDAGRFGEIWVAGKNRIESKRGYHLVAVNPTTGEVERVGLFDTFANANESTRLAQFIEALPPGEIVAGVAIDEVSSNLQSSAIDALHSIGVEGDLRFQFRAGHAFIGVKGALPGQALERLEGRLPANVAAGKNVASNRAAFALMRIEFDQ